MQYKQASEHLYAELIPLKLSNEEIIASFYEKFSLPVNCSFLNPQRLFQVFSHKSFTHENKNFIKNNEKLEFVGDAVLDLVVSELIFHRYPEKNEGELSKLRSSLVNEASLASVARVIKLNKFLLVGKGELKANGFEKDSLLSDTFEALLGAIFLDHGLDKLKLFFEEVRAYLLETKKVDFLSDTNLDHFDAKTKFQEMVMKHLKKIPSYKFSETKNEKETLFEGELWVEQDLLLKMSGTSKKKTMQRLARKAIEDKILNKYMEKTCY